MKALRRSSLIAALCVAPLLLGRVGGPGPVGSGQKAVGSRDDVSALLPAFHPSGVPTAFCLLPTGCGDATAALTAAQQFYPRVLGDWVGSELSRVNDAEPTRGCFHLVIRRGEGETFHDLGKNGKLRKVTATWSLEEGL